MTLVEDLFEIRSRTEFSANDITMWLEGVLSTLFGIGITKMRTEVIIRGKTRGRADLVVEDSIGIETKHNLINELKDAEIQVKRILMKLEGEGDLTPIGIATDGERWKLYILSDQKLYCYFSFEIPKGMLNEDLYEKLWNGIISLRKEKDRPDPTALTIAEIFRPFGPVYNETRTLLIIKIKSLIEDNPIEFNSKFLPWFEVFSFVYNDFQGRCKKLANYGRDLDDIVQSLQEQESFNRINRDVLSGALELFVRHTYLSLIAKELAALVTLGEDGVDQKFNCDPNSLLTGSAIADCGVHISEENDFFEWPSKSQDPIQLIEAILRPLLRFSNRYNEDIFRHLYESIVDPDTRHELGEFFTPKWIAEIMVNDTILDAKYKILDPACGSGTFLVEALKKKTSMFGREISNDEMEDLLNDIWGIDINPLSVILAKTNIYITISSVLSGQGQPCEIKPNIFVSDTFILPRFSNIEQHQLSESGSKSPVISTPITSELKIPILPSITPKETIEIIENIGSMIEEGKTQFPKNIKSDPNLLEYQKAIFYKMLELRKQYGDNIWKFVLKNYGIPPLLRGKFDVVLGNPPWLSFREGREEIQQNMEQVMLDFNIRPSVQTKTSFNLAVAFFLTSAAFLKPKGLISFVLPMSVLDSPSHLPFIRLLMQNRKFKLNKIYDLSGISPCPFPHSLPTAIITAEVKK